MKALLDVEQCPKPRVLLQQQLVTLHDRRLGEQLLPERGVVVQLGFGRGDDLVEHEAEAADQQRVEDEHL